MVEFDCSTDSEWLDIAGMVGLARTRPFDAAVRQPTLLTREGSSVWQIAIVLSVVAAALHWFISEKPLARPSAGQVTT